MKKNLIITIAFILVGNILFGQNISKETLKAIQNGNTLHLNETVTIESLNNCFDVRDSSYNYLVLSIKMKQQKSLEYFVEKGADMEGVCSGKTPLMYAVKYGQIEMVKFLIEKGAIINTTTSSGKTALDYAKKYNQNEIFVYLKKVLKE